MAKNYQSQYKGTEMDSAWGKALTAVQGVKVGDILQPKDADGNILLQGEPDAYLKSAEVDGNTLTLTEKDGTEVEFSPKIPKRKNPEFYLPVVHRAVPLQTWQRGVIYRVGAFRFFAERLVDEHTIEFSAPQYVCDWVHENAGRFSHKNLAIRAEGMVSRVNTIDSTEEGIIRVYADFDD